MSLDTSGSSLFKRGYRFKKGEAPLKENMAAALVELTNWHADMPFLDPVCGSGTIPIEAAMIGLNRAPGYQRHFAFEDWLWFDPAILAQAKEEADDVQEVAQKLTILASDIDGSMIDIAKLNAHQAGVLHQIQFKQVAIKDFRTELKHGVLVANPPYGERLSDQTAVRDLYRQMGQAFGQMTTWSQYYLTSDLGFEKAFGKKSTKRRKLYNGALRTDLFQYWANKH